MSCFVDYALDFENIRKRLSEFKTNIILCSLEHLTKLNTGDNDMKIFSNLSLFDVKCVFAQVKDLKCIPSVYFSTEPQPSSKVFFYASTSGSCGEVKSIGVTYKCFQPNIGGLG